MCDSVHQDDDAMCLLQQWTYATALFRLHNRSNARGAETTRLTFK